MKRKFLGAVLATLSTVAVAGGLDITLPFGHSAPSIKPVIPASASSANKQPHAQPVEPQRPVPHALAAASPAHVAPVNVSRPAPHFVISSKKSSSQPVNTAPASTASASVGVNPFTGKTLSKEELQRELERAKDETQLLEERLKQANLNADIADLPAKKKAEMAQLLGKNGTTATPSAEKPAKPVAKHKRHHRIVRQKKAVSKVTTVAAPHVPSIELAGVVIDHGAASAILSVDGNSVVVPNGGATPFGALQVMDSDTVRVGAQVMRVHDNTLARVKISDPKPVDPKAQAGATRPAFAGLPMMPGSKSAPSNSPKQPMLPPPPLPPIPMH